MRDSARPISFRPFFQGILVEFLDSHEIDLSNRRTLLHDHDDHLIVDLDADVLEKSRGEQRLDGLGGFVIRHGLADLDGQIAEDRARFGPLNALDANVLYHERLEGKARRGK